MRGTPQLAKQRAGLAVTLNSPCTWPLSAGWKMQVVLLGQYSSLAAPSGWICSSFLLQQSPCQGGRAWPRDAVPWLPWKEDKAWESILHSTRTCAGCMSGTAPATWWGHAGGTPSRGERGLSVCVASIWMGKEKEAICEAERSPQFPLPS